MWLVALGVAFSWTEARATFAALARSKNDGFRADFPVVFPTLRIARPLAWARFFLCLCALVGAIFNAARAQDTLPIPSVVPAAASARALAGEPLFWATGIVDADDLPAYKSLGLNAVVVRLKWNPPENGDLSALDLAPQRAFADAAARSGLQVIYAFPATPAGMEFQVPRIAGDSPSYHLLWTTWVTRAIGALRDTPNLAGWMLPDDPRALPIFDDAGFARWVARNYASVGVVNAQWGASYPGFEAITLESAANLTAQWKEVVAAGGTVPLPQLGGAGAPPLDPNLAFHPAALALAAYRWDAYRRLLTSWIGTIRGADAGHLLFSGALPDYAQLLSMPAGVDVMTPAVAPGIAENDVVTHNPQAIDIARRGGKFAALPIFTAHETGAVPAEDLPALCPRWMQEACARGAVGAAFDSWADIKTDLNLRQAILETLRALSAAPNRALWGEPPVTTTAIILTPLADGATLNFGPPELRARRGLYGWGEDLVADEPSNLVWMMRWGTAFGGVDYLSPDDLDGPLDSYSTILAPQMLSCSIENQSALTNYVGGGGTLVADLGLGALQSGGQAGALPPAMAFLFGVSSAYNVRPDDFNLNGAAPHPLLPHWSERISQTRNISLTKGSGADGTAFSGPVGLSLIPPSAHIVALGPQIGTRINGKAQMLRAPLTINDAARGYAVWAPFRLWSSWLPGQMGFDDFHGDIIGRGATLAVRASAQGPSPDVVPAPVNVAPGATRFPEVVNRAADITLLNHDAPGQPTQLASIETAGVGDWLWSGGIVQLPNGLQQGVPVGGRPAPIDNPGAVENRLRALSLFAVAPSGTMTTLHMEPVSAQNLGGNALCGQVLSNTRAGLDVRVWANAATVVPLMGNDAWVPVPTPLLSSRFRLTVYDSPGGLRLQPGARVRANFTVLGVGANKKPTITNGQQVAVVDARGRAVWELEGADCRVQIAGAG